MKKTLIIAMSGIALSAVQAFAQGNVQFNNYNATTYAPITFGANVPGQTAGTIIPASAGYTAGLYYGLGDITDPTALTLLSGTTATIGTVAPGFFFGTGANSVAAIPGYTSGDVTFMIVAYNGADYVSSAIKGASSLFIVNGLATGSSPVGGFGPGLTAFSVTQPVPEPSTLALAGLGAFGILLAVRRKKA